MRKRRYAILAPGFSAENAKTAHGVISYGSDDVVAVIAPEAAGKRVYEIAPHLHRDAPIVANVREALPLAPTSLLIGVAPKGGKLAPEMRAEVLDALAAGLEIVSGLHDMLGEDAEFAAAAQKSGAGIWDVRKPPDVPLFSGAVYGVAAPIVLAVGNDCAVGKMTVMLELARAAHTREVHAEFVPTGQTGIMIAGWGIAVDRVVSDFGPGAAEQLVLEAAARRPQFILVEGQGSINHPAYAPVTLSLLYGSAPDALVLVVDPQREHIESYGTPTLAYTELIAAYESIAGLVKPANVVGVALNTRGMSERAAREAIEVARTQTGLPASDVVRYGAHKFWDRIAARVRKHAPKAFAALCFVSLVLTGCSRGGAPVRSGGHNPWTVPGTIRVGNSDEPDSLNPLYSHNAAADEVDGLIYSSILRYDQNGNYIPDLATMVPSLRNGGISKDNRTITIHLRHDATWADGVPLTARDWVFTYRTVMNPANNVKTTLGWDNIAFVRTPDPYTIVVRLKQPNAAFLGNLAFGGAAYPPLPQHILGRLHDLNRAEFNRNPLSSGPYVLRQWSHGSFLSFDPNARYFRGTPKVHVLWKIVPDGNTLFNLLQTHEIDVELGVNENDVARLNNIAGITIVKRLIANWRHMGINVDRPLLRDVRVRLALAEGVDWARINDTIYHGYNELAVSDIYPRLWAAPQIPRYTYDPAGARRLLAAAGYTMGADRMLQRGGQPLRLSLSTGTNKQENAEAEVQIQSQLKALGIDIVIRNYPVNVLFDRAGPLYTGNYDLEWSVDTNGPDPDNACEWASDCIPPHGANTSWLRDPIIDRTAHAAVETFDPAQRKRLYQQEEERIHALVPAVFFYWENEYNAINSDAKNVVPAAFIQDTWNSWEWQI